MSETRSFVIRSMPEERGIADAVEDLLRRRESKLIIHVRQTTSTASSNLAMELQITRLIAIYTSADGNRLYLMGRTGACEVAKDGEFAEVSYNRESAEGEVNITSFMPKHVRDKFA